MTPCHLLETLFIFQNCTYKGHLLYAKREDCMPWWRGHHLMYDGVEWCQVAQEKGPVVGSCDHTMTLRVTQTP